MTQAPEVPNINQNPLSDHAETNMLELIYEGKESMMSHMPIVRIPTNKEKSVNVRIQ